MTRTPHLVFDFAINSYMWQNAHILPIFIGSIAVESIISSHLNKYLSLF
jgi:hypothetical protein